MGVYELMNKCLVCGGKRAIHEEWVDNVIETYYVGCNDENCRGYHRDYAYPAAVVRLDMLIARHGGLRRDAKNQTELTALSEGIWRTTTTPTGVRTECALCHRPPDHVHADDCPVQVGREILGEFDVQSSA
jgi:hypothetical protein